MRLNLINAGLENQPDQNTVDVDLGEGDMRTVYLGLSEERVSGLAFEVTNSEGYGGEIVAMLGLDPNGTIYGVEIVRLSETPGLGAKIANPEFRGQFKGKSLSNTNFMLKKDGGDLDQVTGATISPRAIVKGIKEGLEFFQKYRGDILKNNE